MGIEGCTPLERGLLVPFKNAVSRVTTPLPVAKVIILALFRKSACQVHPDELEGVLQQAKPLGVVNRVVGFFDLVGGRIGGISGCRAVDCVAYH
jgi:hypothetical protein